MRVRFISHYKEYPIYVPAINGFYSGNQLVASERKSKRQCRKDFEEIWQNCLKENEQNGFGNNYDEWCEIEDKLHVYPWIRRANVNCIYRQRDFIGSGESYMIERRRGSDERGRRGE